MMFGVGNRLADARNRLADTKPHKVARTRTPLATTPIRTHTAPSRTPLTPHPVHTRVHESARVRARASMCTCALYAGLHVCVGTRVHQECLRVRA